MSTYIKPVSPQDARGEELAIALRHLLPAGYVVPDGFYARGQWHSVMHEMVREAKWGHVLTPEEYAPVLAFDLLIGNLDRVDYNHGVTAGGEVVLFDNADSMGNAHGSRGVVDGIIGYLLEDDELTDEESVAELRFYLKSLQSDAFADTVDGFIIGRMDVFRAGGQNLLDNLHTLYNVDWIEQRFIKAMESPVLDMAA